MEKRISMLPHKPQEVSMSQPHPGNALNGITCYRWLYVSRERCYVQFLHGISGTSASGGH